MCHGERSDLFVVESLGTVVPACSSGPCGSAGSALVPGGGYFSYLFLVSAHLDAGKESKSVGWCRLSETRFTNPSG